MHYPVIEVQVIPTRCLHVQLDSPSEVAKATQPDTDPAPFQSFQEWLSVCLAKLFGRRRRIGFWTRRGVLPVVAGACFERLEPRSFGGIGQRCKRCDGSELSGTVDRRVLDVHCPYVIRPLLNAITCFQYIGLSIASPPEKLSHLHSKLCVYVP